MSARLRAIVDDLGLRGGERVLEIGCGPGVAVTYMCDAGAEVLGIDRSEKAIMAARKRNGDRAEFGVAELESLDLGDRRFDVILAVRVGLFHREPARARALVESYLAPGGRLHVVFDTPS